MVELSEEPPAAVAQANSVEDDESEVWEYEELYYARTMNRMLEGGRQEMYDEEDEADDEDDGKDLYESEDEDATREEEALYVIVTSERRTNNTIEAVYRRYEKKCDREGRIMWKVEGKDVECVGIEVTMKDQEYMFMLMREVDDDRVLHAVQIIVSADQVFAHQEGCEDDLLAWAKLMYQLYLDTK